MVDVNRAARRILANDAGGPERCAGWIERHGYTMATDQRRKVERVVFQRGFDAHMMAIDGLGAGPAF
jgi:hypothetical protein